LICIKVFCLDWFQDRETETGGSIMGYGTIMASIQSAEDVEAVMPVAMMIAKNHAAHVIGLHVMSGPPSLVHTPYDINLLVEAEERMREAARTHAGELRGSFDALVRGEADAVGEWRAVETPMTSIESDLIDHARCSDLVMIAQPDSQDNANRLGTVGEAILQTGRPVLVVPYAWSARSIGKRAFIAWNGSRESTRAVFDALPFLREAEEVRLYVVEGSERDDARVPGAELAATLSRHGVRVTAEKALKTGLSVADTLLSRLADHGSDLLVMGGYGHSRAREYVFGGVTREILKSMTVPVLFSH